MSAVTSSTSLGDPTGDERLCQGQAVDETGAGQVVVDGEDVVGQVQVAVQQGRVGRQQVVLALRAEEDGIDAVSRFRVIDQEQVAGATREVERGLIRLRRCAGSRRPCATSRDACPRSGSPRSASRW